MRSSMLEHLACPQTGQELAVEITREDGDHIVEGALLSGEAGIRYPIHGGIPRFVEVENIDDDDVRATAETFSEKWTQIPDYAADGETKKQREAWYFERFGFQNGDASLRDFLRDSSNILEVGTGAGVDTDLLTRNSDGLVFGVDIGGGIEFAYERFKDDPRICLMQADLAALPFRENFFDVISCDQVLHHSSDPPRNFSHLASKLGKNGRIVLYVYKKKGALREFADDYLRERVVGYSLEEAIRLSRSMAELGRELQAVGGTVTLTQDIPELGIEAGEHELQRLIYDHILKCFWNDRFDSETNTMVNFDWYRPVHAFRYTPEQVEEWVDEASMEMLHVDVCPSGISIIARRQRAASSELVGTI